MEKSQKGGGNDLPALLYPSYYDQQMFKTAKFKIWYSRAWRQPML